MTTPSSVPVVQMPGSFSSPAVAPVYVDGIPITNAGTPSASSSSSQDFWSSQLRLAGDPAVEQLTVTLGQPRLINYIAADLPHFPHTMTFYWWDGEVWQPVNGGSGAPLKIITTGSVPAVVDNPAALTARLNPYHYGAGHWVHYDEQVQPFTTSRLLLCGVRPAPAAHMQLPVNPSGKVTPYPLGVRNLDFGCRMTSSSDVPPMPRSPVTLSQRQPFTTTVDINGSPVQVAMRENRAGDLLAGGTWRCGPQPSSSSVACLYLDSRDENGNAQLIDRFYLNPITSGVRFNLYYSATPPPAGTVFEPLDDPLLPSLLNAAGTQLPAVTRDGIVFTQWPGWLTLSNQAAGTVADNPWWTGIEIAPSFSSDDPGTYVIADAGLLQLSYSDGAWTVTMPTPDAPGAVNQPSGGVLGQWAFEFAAGDRIQFIAGYDGQQFFAWCPLGAMYQTPVVPPVPPAPVFCFGGLQGIDPSQAVLAGNYMLTSFILKQEVASPDPGGAVIPPDFLAFAADPDGYVNPPAAPAASTAMNAVARFSPGFVAGSINPWGFAGGLGSAYESCPWVPVQRSYVLAKGYVEFDPVMAAAWKFEFTNLQPEPYEYLKPPQVTSKYFLPQNQPSAADASPTTPAALDAGLAVGQDIAPSVTFNDAPPPQAAPQAGAALPTEALYAPDPSAAAQMAELGGSLYNFQPWQSPTAIPSSAGGASAYQEQTITVTSRIAYFVAISSITMWRLDYTAADDTEQYTDIFADTHNISPDTLTPGGWFLQDGGGLVAPSNLTPDGAAVQSQVFNSAHAVTGVQFATVQSDPVQLLEDPDFSDPQFANWSPVGDAAPLTESANSSQLGRMVQVSRGSGAPDLNTRYPASWSYLTGQYPSWGALESVIASWYDFGQPPATSAMGGIGYTGTPVASAGGGRMYAAARVFATAALTAPLYLQLLDGATGTVIAEAEQTVIGGSPVEWFAGFIIGEEVSSQADWAQVQQDYPTWADITAAQPAWNVIDTSQAPLGATITAQVIQKESTGDTWDVDNISVFEDGLVWEFSNDGGSTWYPAYDVRNNPRGVVTFPPAQPGEGTQLAWRLTAYQPGVSVSALAMRPWYVTAPHGIMPRVAGIGHGPNLAPRDQYGPVEDDPRWQLSSSPVPDSWYFGIRQALGISTPADDFPGGPQQQPDVVLGNALTWEPPEPAQPSPQTYTDIYTDTYTDEYAIADGGDVYTDTYCDIYGVNDPQPTGQQWTGTANWDATGYLTVTADTIPVPAAGAGAGFTGVSASSPAVEAWLTAGLPLPARYIPLGNSIPASLAASAAALDAGVRRVQFDVRPDATTTPSQLDEFLASCQAGGLEAAVSIWTQPDGTFSNMEDWLDMLPSYVAAIHNNGYRHVVAPGNNSVNSGWLNAWYPGDDLTDVIAPVFGCSGPAPGSGGPTLAVAEAFADARGKPFGLGGWGFNHVSYTAAQGVAFISYVQRVFTARKAARKPCYDLMYTQSGNYSLLTAPAPVLAAYRTLAAAL